MRATWRSYGVVGKTGLAALLAMSVAGCSTMADVGGLARPGYQKDGTYVLSSEQQSLGCRELQERKLGLQDQLQQLPNKAVQEMQELPRTVADAWGRLVGSPDQGVPALAQYNEAQAEAVALDQSLQQKGCGTSIETASIRR